MIDRYRSFGTLDDPPIADADSGFIGVDEFTIPENLPPGVAQAAVNMDFGDSTAQTRPGFVCLPTLGNAPFAAGTNWTSRTSAADNDWNSIAYGNGLFVAVTSTGTVGTRIMSSRQEMSSLDCPCRNLRPRQIDRLRRRWIATLAPMTA